jgi:hypothetical protein
MRSRTIGPTIERISETTTSISAAVEQQGIAIRSIAKKRSGERHEVAENIERVARGAGEAKTTSSQMLQSARALSEVSLHLWDEVQKFLDSVRAAKHDAPEVGRTHLLLASRLRRKTGPGQIKPKYQGRREKDTIMLCISHPLNHRGDRVGGKNQKQDALG